MTRLLVLDSLAGLVVFLIRVTILFVHCVTNDDWCAITSVGLAEVETIALVVWIPSARRYDQDLVFVVILGCNSMLSTVSAMVSSELSSQ